MGDARLRGKPGSRHGPLRRQYGLRRGAHAAEALLILDAGTGIRPLGQALRDYHGRIDLLLSHLHLDHVQGIGFFEPAFRPDVELHIWGPPSANEGLRERLARYLSPPLFPVRLRELNPGVQLHELPNEPIHIADATITADAIIHPGSTVGYRIDDGNRALAYLPDHEPALGAPSFPISAEWTSGNSLAAGVDLLIHDAQYTAAEYAERVGWGHSSIEQTWAFAQQAGVRRLLTFHHDPSHSDDELDAMVAELQSRDGPAVLGGTEGLELELAAT